MPKYKIRITSQAKLHSSAIANYCPHKLIVSDFGDAVRGNLEVLVALTASVFDGAVCEQRSEELTRNLI